MTGKLLITTAAIEVLAGLALLAVPALVGRFLLGAELVGAAIAVARVAGIALISLGLVCWPGPLATGLLVYNSAVAAYLAYLGASGKATGALLWPIVILHVLLAAAIALELRRSRVRV